MVLRASRYKDKEKLRKTRNAQNKRYFSKTKECEYIIWKEELRASQDDDFVTGMLLGQAMSGGLK